MSLSPPGVVCSRRDLEQRPKRNELSGSGVSKAEAIMADVREAESD